jgi:hypothetical protein
MIFNPTLILTLVSILNLILYNRHSFSGSKLHSHSHSHSILTPIPLPFSRPFSLPFSLRFPLSFSMLIHSSNFLNIFYQKKKLFVAVLIRYHIDNQRNSHSRSHSQSHFYILNTYHSHLQSRRYSYSRSNFHFLSHSHSQGQSNSVSFSFLIQSLFLSSF